MGIAHPGIAIGVVVGLSVGWTGCGSVRGSDPSPTDASSSDGQVGAHRCDPRAPFGPLITVPITAPAGMTIGYPRLSPDELTLYFAGSISGSDFDLYTAVRGSLQDGFGTPQPLTAVNSGANDQDPMVTSDGLTLWFSSDRVANQGSHIYVATRTSTLAAFTGAAIAATVNAADTTVSDIQPFVTADGGELWFSSTRTPTQGSRDIWYATRTGGGLAAPATDIALASSSFDGVPTLSADRLTLVFDSNRTGTGVKGGFDIWIAPRATAEGAFSAPTLLAEVNTAGNDVPGWISSDNCRLYLRNDSSSTTQLFVASRLP